MAERGLVGGLVAGAVATAGALAAGAVADRNRRLRGELPDLDPSTYEHVPDEELVVITSDGLPLHVEVDHAHEPGEDVEGRSATVVFCHGYTMTREAWVLQRRALSQAGFRCVAYDQRGHGLSGVGDGEHNTLAQLAADLTVVLRETCPEGPIVLIGHSMGGMTLMELGRHHPEIVSSRVLAAAFVATSAGGGGLTNLGFGPAVGHILGRMAPKALTRLSHYQSHLNRVRRALVAVEDFAVTRYSFASPVTEELVDFTGDMILGTRLDVMSSFLPAVEGVDCLDALGVWTGIEVLVLNGLGDLLTPPEHSEAIVHRVPGAEHVVIEDAGHLVMLEHPEVVNEQLLMLVERASRAHDTGVAAERQPRVRRTVTDIRRRDAKARSAARRRPRPRAGSRESA